MKANPKREQKLRFARKEDRDYAAALAKEYREHKPVALRQSRCGSRFVPMTGADLAAELEFFARHGTWQREDKARRNELIREWFACLRSQGMSYAKARDATATHWAVGEDLVRHIVDDRKAKMVAPS